MKKSILGFAFLLVLLPLVITITGCEFEIFNWVCDVDCNDDCEITFDSYCAATNCEWFCDVELEIVNLPPGVCKVSSAIVLEKKSPLNKFYVNEKDNNGNLDYSDHDLSGKRIVSLDDCVDIDPSDPAKTVKDFKENIKKISFVIKVCDDDGECTQSPFPGSDKTLKILTLSTELGWTSKWDESSCRLKITVDGTNLQHVITCVNCCQ